MLIFSYSYGLVELPTVLRLDSDFAVASERCFVLFVAIIKMLRS